MSTTPVFLEDSMDKGLAGLQSTVSPTKSKEQPLPYTAQPVLGDTGTAGPLGMFLPKAAQFVLASHGRRVHQVSLWVGGIMEANAGTDLSVYHILLPAQWVQECCPASIYLSYLFLPALPVLHPPP